MNARSGRFANGAVGGASQTTLTGGPPDQLPQTASGDGGKGAVSVPNQISIEQDGFDNWNDAHEAFGKKYYPLGKQEKVEYQTAIVIQKNGKYGFMTPGAGPQNATIVDPNPLFVAIKANGFQMVAWSHTHFDDNPIFSGSDMNFIQSTKWTLFLAGKDGNSRLSYDYLSRAASGYKGTDKIGQLVRGTKGIKGEWP